MKYYIIQNENIMIANSQQALSDYSLPINVLPSDYEFNKYIVANNELVLNPNYEEWKQQQEREKLNNLSLTKREVFLAIYRDKSITPEQIRSMLTSEEAQIEFDYANDYFRGNPLISQLGLALGYTGEDLDYLFEHKELLKEVNNA